MMDRFDGRPYRIEISLDRLEANYLALRDLGGRRREIIAVVKSNAYGHGLEEISGHLYSLGVRKFAVACLGEAIELRRYLGNRDAEILILGYTPPSLAEDIEEFGIIQSVDSPEYASALRHRAGKPLNIHVKLDTGMHRRGIRADEEHLGEIADIMRIHSPSGIFTHLACADSTDEESSDFTKRQIELFQDAVASLPYPLTAHCLNSYGALNYHGITPDSLSGIIRPGIALYGAISQECSRAGDFAPILSLYSSVAEIKEIYPGESIGYGASFTADRRMRIAIIPIGYGEGYKRALSGKGAVLIGDSLCPIVGRICMNMTAVDISDASAVGVGDTVTLIGGELDASRLGGLVGTISYEILSSLSKDIPRIYK